MPKVTERIIMPMFGMFVGSSLGYALNIHTHHHAEQVKRDKWLAEQLKQTQIPKPSNRS